MSSNSTPPLGSLPGPTTRTTRFVALALLTAAMACTRTPSGGDSIDQEVFIQTYVDLRVMALDTDSQRLADVDRDAVLARHGVSGTDLTNFAEIHGADLEFMRDVWNEVELRMDRPPEANR